jgi:hypothetical protein
VGGFLFEFLIFSGAFGFSEPPRWVCVHGHDGQDGNNKGDKGAEDHASGAGNC